MADLVKLTDPNGVEVQVSADKAKRLIGYKPADEKPAARKPADK